MKTESSLQQMVLEQLHIHIQRRYTEILHVSQKLIPMDHRLKCKMQNYKLSRR